MKKTVLRLACLIFVIFSSCSKPEPVSPESAKFTSPASAYKAYTIQKGQHYCDQNGFSSITVSTAMRFNVKFDQSAIYTTVDPENQYDINKIWGFSEGLDHQYNSARIGWAYNDGALRLYGYVYVNGVRQSTEITNVQVGAEIPCSIELMGNTYVFTANGVKVTLPRAASGTKASGYWLYPYFGGDEVAPQNILIAVQQL